MAATKPSQAQKRASSVVAPLKLLPATVDTAGALVVGVARVAAGVTAGDVSIVAPAPALVVVVVAAAAVAVEVAVMVRFVAPEAVDSPPTRCTSTSSPFGP